MVRHGGGGGPAGAAALRSILSFRPPPNPSQRAPEAPPRREQLAPRLDLRDEAHLSLSWCRWVECELMLREGRVPSENGWGSLSSPPPRGGITAFENKANSSHPHTHKHRTPCPSA